LELRLHCRVISPRDGDGLLETNDKEGMGGMEERMNTDRKADKEDFLARMDAIHEERMAMLDANQKRMMACLGHMEANT
jgi:hypothetical protein